MINLLLTKILVMTSNLEENKVYEYRKYSVNGDLIIMIMREILFKKFVNKSLNYYVNKVYDNSELCQIRFNFIVLVIKMMLPKR